MGPIKKANGNAGAKSTDKTSVASEKNQFPVVGVGASAGGLEAVTKLLKKLPPNLNAALVVIQHLDPKHESMSVEILSLYNA